MLFCTLLDILNLRVAEVHFIGILNICIAEVHFIDILNLCITEIHFIYLYSVIELCSHSNR